MNPGSCISNGSKIVYNEIADHPVGNFIIREDRIQGGFGMMTATVMTLFPLLLLIVIPVLVVVAVVKSSRGRDGNSYPADRGYKVLCRSQSDRVFAGVCGGIAEYFGWNSMLVRLFFIFSGIGLLTYVILAIAIPDGPSPLL